jgi:hypothetical protein
MDLSGELIGDEGVEHPEFVYSETYHAQLVEENRYAVEMSEKYEWGWRSVDNVVSLRTVDRKLICTANGSIEPAYLFDLVEDPGEENNLIDDPGRQQEVLHLKGKLMEMIKDDIQYKYDTIKEEVKGIKSAIRSKRLKGI